MWTMPVTATEEERVLGRGLVRSEGARNGCVVVVGGSRETRRAISDAVELRQSCVLECRLKDKIAANGVTAIVWDTTSQSAGDPEQVALLKARFHDAPILALVTFPRRHDVQKIIAAGVDGVLAKPWLIDDLLAQIEQLAERRVAVG